MRLSAAFLVICEVLEFYMCMLYVFVYGMLFIHVFFFFYKTFLKGSTKVFSLMLPNETSAQDGVGQS